MKGVNFSKKATILTIFFTMAILCGALFFAASSNTGNTTVFTPEDMLHLQSIDLGNELERLDKINEADVLITASGNEIDRVYITMTLTEELAHPEADNIIKFVSDYFEGLTDEFIEITYVDTELNPY